MEAGSQDQTVSIRLVSWLNLIGLEISPPTTLEQVVQCLRAGLSLSSKFATITQERWTTAERWVPIAERAIALLQTALTVLIEQKDALDWASAHRYLGIAYENLAVYQAAEENLVRAIAHYENAKRALPNEENRGKWIDLRSHLAACHNRLARVSQQIDHFAKSIAYAEEILSICDKAEFPEHWANAQNARAASYANLAVFTHQATDFHEAISGFLEVLTVHTQKSAPVPWGRIHMSMAEAYHRLAGVQNPAENLRHSIACYNKVLAVRTREVYPSEYEQTRECLIAVQKELQKITEEGTMTGDEHIYWLDEYGPDAPAYSFDTVVSPIVVPPTSASEIPEPNLENAYGNLPRLSDTPDALTEAIARYSAALEITSEVDLPREWAAIQIDLANTYRSLAESQNRETNLEKAIACYHDILQVRPNDLTPLLLAQTKHHLAIAQLLAGEYAEAFSTLRLSMLGYRAAGDNASVVYLANYLDENDKQFYG